MLTPKNFRDMVVPHGTSCIIVDPHEITNVSGIEGINYLLDNSKDLDIKIYVMLPSYVPCSEFYETGARLSSNDLKDFYSNKNIYGLTEMMNIFGIINGNIDCIEKCVDCINQNKYIDGHAPLLTGDNLNAYMSMCISSGHECNNIENSIEKIKKGIWIQIREGTVCKDLNNLIDLFKSPYYQRCMLSTDDTHPDTIKFEGHIDKIIRKATSLGANPIISIKMASLNPSIHYGLKYHGAIAIGYIANFIILNDLNKFDINSVYLKGIKVSESNKVIINHHENTNQTLYEKYPRIFESFNINEIKCEHLKLNENHKFLLAIELQNDGIITTEYITQAKKHNNDYYSFGVNLDEDIAKIIVAERYKKTGHIGIGFIKGFGIKRGAISSSVGHDSHNIIAIGMNDNDIIVAVNNLIKNKGGISISLNNKILGELILEVGGIITNQDEECVINTLNHIKNITYEELEVNKNIDPFMTLSFMQLPVVPNIKITSLGLIDVKKQQIVDTLFD